MMLAILYHRLTADEPTRLRAAFLLGCVIIFFTVWGANAQEIAHADDDRVATHYAPQVKRKGVNSVSLSGIVPQLAAKAREITAACGSKVVSAIRVGARVYGGSASNHASGRAVDLQGNPACMYARLKGWQGGMSTDYHTAPGGPHLHLSWNPGGMEWGLRFKHRHPKRRAR